MTEVTPRVSSTGSRGIPAGLGSRASSMVVGSVLGPRRPVSPRRGTEHSGPGEVGRGQPPEVRTRPSSRTGIPLDHGSPLARDQRQPLTQVPTTRRTDGGTEDPRRGLGGADDSRPRLPRTPDPP